MFKDRMTSAIFCCARRTYVRLYLSTQGLMAAIDIQQVIDKLAVSRGNASQTTTGNRGADRLPVIAFPR